MVRVAGFDRAERHHRGLSDIDFPSQAIAHALALLEVAWREIQAVELIH